MDSKKNTIYNLTKEKNSMLSKNPEEGPYYILPMLNKTIINNAYQESTSALTKYVKSHAQSIRNEANSYRIFNLKFMKKNLKLRKKKDNYIYKSKTKAEVSDIPSENKKVNFYLSSQEGKGFSNDLKIDDNNNNLKPALTEENNDTINNKTLEPKIKLKETSINVNKALNKNQFLLLNNTFHRLRIYNYKLIDNWKYKNGVAPNKDQKKYVEIIANNEYQSKIFNDQYKLMMESYLHYKMKLLSNNDFIESFKALNLKSRIEFNKSLEEICGLLILLPHTILSEFYKYTDYIKAPNKSSLKDKYIFDELNCLYQNNILLSKLMEFFQSCFEMYLILGKEVEGMYLSYIDFNNAISSFEKIRFNLSFICNMAENALINYTKEMGLIFKLNRFESKQNKINNAIYTSKLKNYKSLSKNRERQRKLRINECLSIKDDLNIRRDIYDRKKFKSIINTKFISKLLRHCKKDARYNIITERINTEFDSFMKNENKNKPIKINF